MPPIVHQMMEAAGNILRRKVIGKIAWAATTFSAAALTVLATISTLPSLGASVPVTSNIASVFAVAAAAATGYGLSILQYPDSGVVDQATENMQPGSMQQNRYVLKLPSGSIGVLAYSTKAPASHLLHPHSHPHRHSHLDLREPEFHAFGESDGFTSDIDNRLPFRVDPVAYSVRIGPITAKAAVG